MHLNHIINDYTISFGNFIHIYYKNSIFSNFTIETFKRAMLFLLCYKLMIIRVLQLACIYLKGLWQVNTWRHMGGTPVRVRNSIVKFDLDLLCNYRNKNVNLTRFFLLTNLFNRYRHETTSNNSRCFEISCASKKFFNIWNWNRCVWSVISRLKLSWKNIKVIT